jgi:hypothetical protein
MVFRKLGTGLPSLQASRRETAPAEPDHGRTSRKACCRGAMSMMNALRLPSAEYDRKTHN